MKSFSSGLSYLRQEALKSGFIIESDTDDKLIERLSQIVRKLGAKEAKKCDEMTKAGNEVEQSSDKGPKGKA